MKQGGKPKQKTLYEHPVGGARPVDDEDIVEWRKQPDGNPGKSPKAPPKLK